MINELELTWQTFEFHSAQIHKLEGKHLVRIEKVNKLLNKKEFISKPVKMFIKTEVLAKCRELQTSYQKHIQCLDDLINLYKYHELNGKVIPVERETDVRLFAELKEVSSALSIELSAYQLKISRLLGH